MLARAMCLHLQESHELPGLSLSGGCACRRGPMEVLTHWKCIGRLRLLVVCMHIRAVCTVRGSFEGIGRIVNVTINTQGAYT